MTANPSAENPQPVKHGPLRRLYEWTLLQARGGHAERALFWVAFIESSFFPVPPDILLMAMVLSHRSKWFRYLLICSTGSVLGGIAGYLIGMGVWEVVHGWFFAHVFSEQIFEKVRHLYVEYDFWIVFVAGFTPIPYKVFTITAGVAAISFPRFVLASLISRSARFFLVSYLLHRYGDRVRRFIEKYFNLLTILFTVLLVGGFFVLKVLAGH